MSNDPRYNPQVFVVATSWRERLLQWGVMVLGVVLAAIAARWGIEIPPPPMPPTGPPGEEQPPPDTKPPEPSPDPLAAIVRISSGNVGCSATVIGPRRPDGRYWVLTAAHCVQGAGQRWTMRFRDGRSVGCVVTNFDRRADWCWCVTDANNVTLPHALLAQQTPSVGTRIWHAGFGVDIPANREDGTITGGENADGQIRMRLSVSSGDSGGGIVIDADGRIVSTVCCTTRRGGVGDVWGASVERIRAGQRDRVDLDDWRPLEIPLRPIPKEMPKQ